MHQIIDLYIMPNISKCVQQIWSSNDGSRITHSWEGVGAMTYTMVILVFPCKGQILYNNHHLKIYLTHITTFITQLKYVNQCEFRLTWITLVILTILSSILILVNQETTWVRKPKLETYGLFGSYLISSLSAYLA